MMDRTKKYICEMLSPLKVGLKQYNDRFGQNCLAIHHREV